MKSDRRFLDKKTISAYEWIVREGYGSLHLSSSDHTVGFYFYFNNKTEKGAAVRRADKLAAAASHFAEALREAPIPPEEYL